METLLLFPRTDGTIDGLSDRDFAYNDLIELKEYIRGAMITFGEWEMNYLNKADKQEVERILSEKYSERFNF